MKPALSFFLVFCFFSLFVSVSYGQIFDYNKAYEDYLFNLNQYRQNHQSYENAKNAYLTYKTLTAETTALEETKKMLSSRDEAMRTYLVAIRMKLAEVTNIVGYPENTAYLKLESEIAFLLQHKNSLPSAGNLEDLLKLSSEAEDRHPTTEILSYQTLGLILSGKIDNLRKGVVEQSGKTEEKIAEIRKEGRANTDKVERWMIEANNRLKRSEEKQKEAEGIIAAIKESDNEKTRRFGEAQLAYEEANQYLKETVSYLKEIILEIKELQPNE